jgi:hypothetical protein
MDDQRGPNTRWYHVKDFPNFAIGVLTLIALGIYAGFTKQQVTETQNANRIAKQALAEVNRPYVMFTGIAPNITSDTRGNHTHIGLNWTNFGNTPSITNTWYMCKPIIKSDVITPNYKCDLAEPTTPLPVIGPKQPMGMIVL